MRQPEPGVSAVGPREPGSSLGADSTAPIIGHYQILAELGRGGMGIVYRARDLNLGRLVALKTPLPEHRSERGERRFLREAKAAAGLSHPHIVPVFEVLEHDGAPWVAMELVDGQTLRAHVQSSGPLAPETVLRHAEGLAEALQTAHGKHVLHRDITPNNIMMTADGRAVLMDFGLAQIFYPPGDEAASSNETWSVTEGRDLAGTPAYMSPEQVLGKPLDARSDLFSFGAVLYEMCAGAPPFWGPDRGAVFDAVLHQDPPPIARRNVGIPAELERIVRKSLAKRPDERYQHAADLAADLRSLRRMVESGREPAPARPAKTRTRLVYGAVALAAVVAVAGIVTAALWLWGPREAREAEWLPRQLTSGPALEIEPSLSPDGTLIAYTSNEAGNPDIWIIDARGGKPVRITDDPAPDRTPSWFPDGREVAFVSTRGGRPGIWKVPRLGGAASLLLDNAQDPAISPDGTRLAVAVPGSTGSLRIGIAALPDPGPVKVLTTDHDGLWDHRQPAWSPDGRWLCYSAARDLWLLPAEGGAARRLTQNGEVDFEPTWSHDGRDVYFSSYRDGTLALWRVSARGGEPKRLTLGSGPERHPSASRAGARLAYSTYLDDPDLVFHDLVTGVERRMTGLRDEHAPVLAPDGSAVAFVSDRLGGRFDIWLQPLADGEPLGAPRRLTDQSGSVAQPAYSPDGRWIAYHRVLEGHRDIWVVPTSGGPPSQITDHPAADIHPDWAPDGSQIAFISERSDGPHVWVVPVKDGRPVGPVQQVTFGTGEDEAPAWAPDGKTIAFVRQMRRREREVWVTPVGGAGAARMVTSGAQAERVRWNAASTTLIASGLWGGEILTLRKVPVSGGAAIPYQPPVLMSETPGFVHFDISRDGRTVVFARVNSRSDIWMLEAQRGSY